MSVTEKEVLNLGFSSNMITSHYVVFDSITSQGLIVNVSSIGGLKYLFNVAYGIGEPNIYKTDMKTQLNYNLRTKRTKICSIFVFSGKAACDRMAADCGFELKKRGGAMGSLWPGAVKTEYIQVMAINAIGIYCC